MAKRSESDIVRACLSYLSAAKVMAFRNNTGAIPVGKRFVRFGAVGSGDIFAILKGGRFMSIECKTDKGLVSEAQERWADEVERAGGLACVVRSVDDLADYIEAWNK